MTANSNPPEQLMSHLVLPASFFAQRPLVTADGSAVTADDRFALMDLVNRVEWCIGSRQKEAYKNLFTEDAVFDHAAGRVQGNQNVADLTWQIPYYGLRHMFLNHVPFIDDQGYLAMLSHILVVQVVAEHSISVRFPAILDQGVVRFVFQKQAGSWRISEMVFEQQKLADFSGAPPEMLHSMAQTQTQRQMSRTTGEVTPSTL
ncbi:nuclear transport factor 2 family protein [Leptolyngbya sp. NIES-2104]|uniref:nuclear transport factor 2 family protein n=1 Tax=Leptolyngbya sp. NIES-2104 TaxID=1552121 RepID=UPI0006ECA127|nr:nuclear transport factor 2 family protein [Leptolyngbya sp. NIES-2104]GAP97985.1 hypothetical protein NIES2104_45380 [Leptolyngbya sp. NIES-2104]